MADAIMDTNKCARCIQISGDHPAGRRCHSGAMGSVANMLY
jgi:hypothetical protein